MDNPAASDGVLDPMLRNKNPARVNNSNGAAL